MTTPIDYSGIVEAIGEQLKNYPGVSALGARVLVEQDPVFGLPDDGGRAIVVTANTRRASPGQPMSAGRRGRMRFIVAVWAIGFDAADYRSAAAKRDVLIAQVELGIMSDRSIGSRVSNLEIIGGDFLAATNPGSAPSFASMGETRLEMDVSAIS